MNFIDFMRDQQIQTCLCFGIILLFVIAAPAIADTTEEMQASGPKKSPIKIGGAFRVNHVYGTYGDADTPNRRGEKIGDADLDILRLDADLDYRNIIGRLEYRWYNNYGMIHSGWLGYKSDNLGTLKAGIVRVPFGPGPYGVSTSWFFDQHFYVGLADDPDLGITWTRVFDKLTLDVAYYLQSEFQTDGSSLTSSRYGYDIVPWEEKVDVKGNVEWGADENGFEEHHQFNLRAIYAFENSTDVGVSLQYGLLNGINVDADRANHYAFSAHLKNTFANFTLFSQFSYYAHNITDATPWGTGELIPIGAYDFAWPIASNGWIPALSLRYAGIDVSGISWFDSFIPHVEWSTLLKTVETYNPSTLIALGANSTLWETLQLSSEIGFSDGNYFVGSRGDNYENIYEGVGDFGANGNNTWNWRLNFNFGYYF